MVDYLDELTRAMRLRKQVDSAITKALREARKGGATWEKIGEAMGISRQGAMQYATRNKVKVK